MAVTQESNTNIFHKAMVEEVIHCHFNHHLNLGYVVFLWRRKVSTAVEDDRQAEVGNMGGGIHLVANRGNRPSELFFIWDSISKLFM